MRNITILIYLVETYYNGFMNISPKMNMSEFLTGKYRPMGLELVPGANHLLRVGHSWIKIVGLFAVFAKRAVT
jgi:hypothetical protein